MAFFNSYGFIWHDKDLFHHDIYLGKRLFNVLCGQMVLGKKAAKNNLWKISPRKIGHAKFPPTLAPENSSLFRL